MSSIGYLVLLVTISAVSAENGILNQKYHPPELQIKLPLTKEDQARIAAEINQLPDNGEGSNPWELSGLFEGDILRDPWNTGFTKKNGLAKESYRWTHGVVPYYIKEKEFTNEQKLTILLAMDEYHNRTCIRFRPYRDTDQHWIVLQSNASGCWSNQGMMTKGGQAVNLQSPRCVRHGVVVHELLHALGFVHQQCAPNRDKFIRILWDNIKNGTEQNFKKRQWDEISNYGVEYDYGSVLHYGRMAFSKNGLPTIETLVPNVEIGQRKGLSEKDAWKVEGMYGKECAQDRDSAPDEGFLDQLHALLSVLDTSTTSTTSSSTASSSTMSSSTDSSSTVSSSTERSSTVSSSIESSWAETLATGNSTEGVTNSSTTVTASTVSSSTDSSSTIVSIESTK